MNINLHNYEELFLLYADNELSHQERARVEQFVQENPELEEEFDMIRMAVVEPDESFSILDKSFLFKSTESDLITEQNYEEIFILFHDGELLEEQKNETVVFLENHPELKDSFELLSQAKIVADPVIFPDMQSLFRNEKQGVPGRVILFRSLAAAAVLAFGIWLTIPYFSGEQAPQQVAGRSKIVDNGASNSAGINVEKKNDHQVATVKKSKTETEIDGGLIKPEVDKSTKKEKVVQEKSNQIMLAKNGKDRSENYLPEEKSKNARINRNKEEDEQFMIAQIPQKDMSASGVIHSNEMTHVDLDITQRSIEKTGHAQNVVYLDVDKASTENYIFYNVPADEFKKTKIGGFLKKLKRVAERNDPIKRLFDLESGQVVSRN